METSYPDPLNVRMPQCVFHPVMIVSPLSKRQNL